MYIFYNRVKDFEIYDILFFRVIFIISIFRRIVGVVNELLRTVSL